MGAKPSRIGSAPFSFPRILFLFDPFQIKNLVSTAHALATQEGCEVTMSHVDVAIDACEDFERDVNGAGATDAMNGYL